jgi:hypothetical protein
VGKTSRAVPETDDLNLLILMTQLVENAVGAANDFAKIRPVKFRNPAADFWEVRQPFGAGD